MSAVRRWAEPGPATRDQAGFTLFELIIVIILVGLLFLTATWRLLPLRGSAEQAHVTTTVGTLRSALGLHVAERVVKDSLDAVAGLEGSNPMQLLERAPDGYIGEIDSPRTDIAPGSWYFDKRTGRLGYRLRYPQYLVGSPKEPVDLYWRIKVQFDGGNGDAGPEAGTGTVRAVSLEALHHQRWQEFATTGIQADSQE